MKIKNIIFDLGNVILNVDFNLTYELLKSNINDNQKFDNLMNTIKNDKIPERLDKGELSTIELRNYIKSLLNENIDDCKIDEIWLAMLKDFPANRIDYLKKIKNKYRTFLLSNTCELHYIKYSYDLKNNYDVYLEDIFEKAYFSFKLGLIKPDMKIFKIVLFQKKLFLLMILKKILIQLQCLE